jgi:hypothetical protein
MWTLDVWQPYRPPRPVTGTAFSQIRKIIKVVAIFLHEDENIELSRSLKHCCTNDSSCGRIFLLGTQAYNTWICLRISEVSFSLLLDLFSSCFNVILISHQQTFSQKAFMFSTNKLSKQKFRLFGSRIYTTGKSHLWSIVLSLGFNINFTSGSFCLAYFVITPKLQGTFWEWLLFKSIINVTSLPL